MTDFKDTIAGPVDEAVAAAGDCTRRWFDTIASVVDGAVSETTTADALAKDLALLAAEGARDAARVMSAWVTIGQAITNLDLPGQEQGGPG